MSLTIIITSSTELFYFILFWFQIRKQRVSWPVWGQSLGTVFVKTLISFDLITCLTANLSIFIRPMPQSHIKCHMTERTNVSKQPCFTCWSHHLNWCHWVQVQPLRRQHFPLYLSCTFLATDRSNRFDFSSVVPCRNAHFVFVFITPSSFPLLPWWVSVSLRFVEVKIDHLASLMRACC